MLDTREVCAVFRDTATHQYQCFKYAKLYAVMSSPHLFIMRTSLWLAVAAMAPSTLATSILSSAMGLVSSFSFDPTRMVIPDPGTALYTNAVSYCAEPTAVKIDAFDIALFKENKSLSFSFAIASIDNDISPTANIHLNAYGNTLQNITFNLCDHLEGLLCPLPRINFTGEFLLYNCG